MHTNEPPPEAGHHRNGRRRRVLAGAGGVVGSGALVAGLLGAGGVAAASTHKAVARSTAHLAQPTNKQLGIPASPHHGGSLTVFEWSGYEGSWSNLDPPDNTTAGSDLSFNDAIFGQLFDLGPGGKMLPDLATGYSYSNGGKTIDVTLRKNVRFSDGTRLTSSAVKWNWERDIHSSSSSKPIFESVQTTPPVVRTHGPYAISITFKYVNAAFIDDLQGGDILNYMASPTAYKKMGKKAFALKPVGAGPFEVVSDTPGTKLVLKRNPHYFMKGHPYLNRLTFKTVADDEAALVALEAGDGQAYEDLSTPSLVKAFKARFDVTQEPSTSPYDLQFNTAVPPFDNVKARRAVYDAIDCPLLDKKLFNDENPCGQSFTAPAGLFYEKHVPGYPTYDLAKAKALVKQLGGLHFNLFTIKNTEAENLDEALQTEFQAAGMKVTLSAYDLGTLVSTFQSGKWQIGLQTAGAWDPAAGVGVCFRFCSTSPFTGVHSKQLDRLLNHAANTTKKKRRHTFYNAASELIARKAWGPFLFALDGRNVAIHGAGAPGLSTPLPTVSVTPTILWQYAYNNHR